MRHLPIPNKRLIFFIIFDLALIAIAFVWLSRVRDNDSDAFLISGDMKISSSAFTTDGMLPAEYTCDGPGTSPPLGWTGVPDKAKSLVIVVDDPDAPSGTWTHWTAWNIAPDGDGIPAGTVPAGATQGVTSAHTNGWHAPCPPFGEHRYFFKLYALDARLSLPASADAAALEKAMEGHILDKAGLVGRYARSGS